MVDCGLLPLPFPLPLDLLDDLLEVGGDDLGDLLADSLGARGVSSSGVVASSYVPEDGLERCGFTIWLSRPAKYDHNRPVAGLRLDLGTATQQGMFKQSHVILDAIAAVIVHFPVSESNLVENLSQRNHRVKTIGIGSGQFT